MDLLDITLSSMISAPALRLAVIRRMFDLEITPTEFLYQNNGFDTYFNDWFQEECGLAQGQVGARTVREIVDLVVYLRGATNKTKSEIKEAFRSGIISTTSSSSPSQNQDEEFLNVSIDLAARLWLMVTIGTLQHCLRPGRVLAWNNEGNLADTVHRALCSDPQLMEEKIKLPKVFTAANLERIAGIRVVWTSNLADHLSLTEDDTKITLFHQVSFLQLHKDSKSHIFNDDLIDETIRTLGLLLPSTDPKSRKWFSKKQKELHLDRKAGSYGPLKASARQIDRFHYWRDRLVILKQTFDDSEPRTVSLWWYDDRKKVQWYTFWLAALVLLLTIVFGLIQSISGIVQAWAAVHSMPP